LTDKPKQIFNCDETGFSAKDAGKEKAFGVKGEQLHQVQVYLIVNQNYVKYKICCPGTAINVSPLSLVNSVLYYSKTPIKKHPLRRPPF
jgi:energy-converting hydrogenase Eha subunit F